MLASFVSDHKRDWDDHLPFVMAAYRSSVHESTGFTPMKMMTGQEMNLPIDLMIKEARTPLPVGLQTAGQYVTWVKSALQDAYDCARETLGKAAIRQKRVYDQKAVNRKFPRGSWVLRYYPPTAQHKLNKPWIGPYLVVNDAQGWTIGIQRVPGGVVKWVHIDDVKGCSPPSRVPNWVLDSQAASIPHSIPARSRVNIPKTIIMESTHAPCEGGDGEVDSSDSSRSTVAPPLFFRGDKSPLSNFFPVRIWQHRKWFESTEHLYQYEKAVRFGTRTQQLAIWRATKPVTAMKLGKKIHAPPTWAQDKVEVMRDLLWRKVVAISTMREFLLDTGTRVLVEATGHMFWGAGLNPPEVSLCPLANLPGQNKLGQMWMEIREALRTDDIPPQYVNREENIMEDGRLRMNRNRLLQQ